MPNVAGGEFNYAYQSEPITNTANRVHTLNAGKALGGGSILNYGGWLRADAADYDEWAEIVGDKRCSYAGIKPWLQKPQQLDGSEAHAEGHGFDGPMHITSVSASESGERNPHALEHRRNLDEVLTVYVPPGIPGIPVDGTHIATSTMLLLPTSRGRVSIRSSSPANLPRIQPDYFATQLDRDALIHAARQTLKLMLGTGPMKGIVEGETPPSGEGLEGSTPLTADAADEQIEERIRRTGTQHHHSGGTAAMGKVVDTEGRVLGVKGLRVADASIIPLPLGGHPQATPYGMAEQLVSFIIRGAWRGWCLWNQDTAL
ncbi:uncharacterized protein JN550_011957 [Neoarthrinium moseri]|uniref:uncharacterized protein n=1 Tax=Neoarthrinium moseri TaxID=1658444 RepID=UPI001FDDB4CD|nr:uncharacterized protein JN550_011957 [Neoarthrinium moseri]KAI1859649.1 hypothetical protein JN550_011957 [Neoarthrinium moseri]